MLEALSLSPSKMADNHQEITKGEQATVGMKADVKAIQQLSSSARAALEKRNRIKDEKALRLLDEAVQQGLERETQKESSNRPKR